jgi:C-terminal processing protease CtpA/Prc
MGRALGIWATILAAIIGAAPAHTPLRDEIASTAPLSKAAAQKFAGALHAFILEVQSQYVREVSEVDLIVAAMSALHESAGVTPPADLRDRLHAFKKDEGTYPAKCVALMAQLRAELGDRREWRDQKDVIASVNGLSRVLDPYCGFIKPREFTLDTDGEFGTGIQFNNVPSPTAVDQQSGRPVPLQVTELGQVPASLLVKQVIPGGPSQRAGLRPGDTILKIDGRSCEQVTWAQIYATFFPTNADLPGPTAPRVHHIEFRRPGFAKPRVAELLPVGRFLPESVFGVKRESSGNWDYLISPADRLCYARVGPISLTTHEEVQALLAQVVGAGHQGLLLDLRWCPGGYLTPAQGVARSFLNHDEPIAKIQYRRAGSAAAPEQSVVRFPDIPVVVLINNETMGGGELIAAALQDYERGTIAGERTFGKASVQNPLENNPLSMPYRISSGEFLSPKSKRLDRFVAGDGEWGVRPDAERWLPTTPELSNQLKEWWTWQALRPAGSNDALPTDDLDADPQLKAAVQMLRQITNKAKS